MTRIASLSRRQLADPQVQAGLTVLGEAAAREFWETFNPKAFFRHWGNRLADGSASFFVSFDGERITGMLSMTVWVDDFSGKLTAGKTHWYVLPEARNSTAGPRLWAAFTSEAERRGCTRVLTSCPTESKVKEFFARAGYNAVSVTFQKL